MVLLRAEMLESRVVPTATPQLLTDINTQPAGIADSSPIAEMNGLGYFVGGSGFVSGSSTIWKSDGTTAGSSAVVQLQNGSGSPTLTSGLTNVNGTLFFRSNDGVNGWELWSSDGTAAGTHLVKDINPGLGDSAPSYFTNLNGTLFFSANDGTHGVELWKSDGTAAGTMLVQEVNAGSADARPNHLTAIGGLLYFGANDGVNGKSLWRTDGTAQGTIELLGPAAIPTSSIALPPIVEMNGAVYFAGNDGADGVELWKTDGTVAGTSQVADIHAGPGSSNPSAFVNVGGTLFFEATDGVHGSELWKSDGTASGTSMVADLAPGSTSAAFSLMANAGGRLVFFAQGAQGLAIWTSDGTASGTQTIGSSVFPRGFSPTPAQVNGVLYFEGNTAAAGDELWRTDGTASGTYLVKDIVGGPGGSGPLNLANIGGKLFFRANASPSGLWVSDGTSQGTLPVTFPPPATAPGVVSDVSNQAQIGSELYFAGDDGLSGDELWKTDGTASGTVRVKDIIPGPSGSRPIYFANANGRLFFTTIDPVTFRPQLWQSDGTEQGTIVVTDADGNVQINYWPPASVNGKLFFVGENNSLRETDGTPGGAAVVKAGINGTLGDLLNVGGTLYFVQSELNDEVLWKSDGTSDGTVVVAGFSGGASVYVNHNFTNVNGTLFFAEHTDSEGTELWKTDGTTDGAMLVKDIAAGSGDSKPTSLANINGTLYFTANDGVHGAELWKSDGTDAGTVMVRDIKSGAGDSQIRYLTNVNGSVLFSANDGVSGAELWKTDGTANGTVLVQDIVSGSGGSSLAKLTNIGGLLYFDANDGVHGTELWRSDGTAAGTFRISDIYPGPGSSGISSITMLGSHLIFVANDGTHGAELWTTVDINAAPSFTMADRSFVVSDEQPPVYRATTIGFGNLSDHQGDGDPFTAYSESEFTVTPVTGRWMIMTTVSPTPGVLGNPPPSIWEDTFTASLEVSRSSGGVFRFDGIDLTRSSNYTLTGLLQGQTVFTASGTAPAGPAGFATLRSPSSATIDLLRISLVRNDVETTNIDNIRLGVPVPSLSLPEWLTNSSAGSADEASQTTTLTVSNDNPCLFLDQPSIDYKGTLTFTPARNVAGMATVTVTLKDDGGTLAGGVDSYSRTFTITVTKAHVWHNAASSLDVTNDGFIAPNDALAIINYINAFGPGSVPADAALLPIFCDVTGDNFVAPNDALAVINHLNAPGGVAGSPATADFVAVDTTTQGNWSSKYGADGYSLNSERTSLPSYATLAFTGALTDIYDGVESAPTSETRALQRPDSSDRFFAAWTGDYGMTIDVDIPDGRQHQVALYFVETNSTSRNIGIDILDATTGDVLDSQSIASFHDGKYLVWNLSGHVQIRFTNLANGLNTVLSGIFFGG